MQIEKSETPFKRRNVEVQVGVKTSENFSGKDYLFPVNVNAPMENFSSEDVFQNFQTAQDVIQSAECIFDASELPDVNPHAEVSFNHVRRGERTVATTWRDWHCVRLPTLRSFIDEKPIFSNYKIEIARQHNQDESVEHWANTFSAESIHIVIDQLLPQTQSHQANKTLDKVGLHSSLDSKEITGLSYPKLWYWNVSHRRYKTEADLKRKLALMRGISNLIERKEVS